MLTTWSPVDEIVWGRLESMALLEVCRWGQVLKFQSLVPSLPPALQLRCEFSAAMSPAIMVMASYAPGTESQIHPPLSVAFIVVYQIIIEKYLVQTLLRMKTAAPPPPPPHNVGLKVLHSN